ncbi:MAG TPA: hypothetical protein EYP02_00840 [Sulfurovum sp.]|nr:hypothetical protein [Sulfurovum sp.]
MGISKLYKCMEKKKVNNSQAREAIYNILMKEDDCMTVSDITKKLSTAYAKKVSLNTIYRHLTFFAECGLVMVIQDDYKKAYYCITDEKAKAFSICTKCNELSKVVNVSEIEILLKKLSKEEFITLHAKCHKCKAV